MSTTPMASRPFFTGRFARTASLVLAAFALVGYPASHALANIKLSSTYQVFSSATQTGQFTIESLHAEEKTYQVQAFAWTLDANGQEVRAPSQDIRFSPSMVKLAPNGRQVVRFLRAPSSKTEEVRYRIVLAEVSPVRMEGSGLAIALNVDFPWIFRSPTAATNLTTTLDGNTLVIRNSGNATAQLMDLRQGETLVQAGLVGYVLPGESERVTLPAGVDAKTLTLTINGTPTPVNPSLVLQAR